MSNSLPIQQGLSPALTGADYAVNRDRESGFSGIKETEKTSAVEVNDDSAGKIVLTDDEIDKTVAELNQDSQSLERKLSFSVGKESGRIVITVTNPETEEIIRQIPPEDMLRVSESLKEIARKGEEGTSGFLFNSEA